MSQDPSLMDLIASTQNVQRFQDLLWEGPQNDPLFWPLFEAYFEAPGPQMGPKMGQFPLRTAGLLKMHFPGRGPPRALPGPLFGPLF